MRNLLLALGLAFAPSLASAQTNDANWRSWQWIEDTASPRAAGLGGAFVALADDAAAVALNPAGLAALPKTDLQVSMLSRGSGSLADGDRIQSRTAIGFVGGSARITPKVALGGYLTEPHDMRVALGLSAGQNQGFLRTTVTDAGVAVGWRPSSRVHLGLRLNITQLRAQGEVAHADATLSYSARSNSEQKKVAGDLGVLLQLTDETTLGVAYTQGARWDALRAEERSGFEERPTLAYQISSPSRLSAGLAHRPSPRFALVGQLDYVLLGRLEDTLQVVRGPVASSDYTLRNALDARAGVELSWAFRPGSVQVRGGVASEAGSGYRFDALHPSSERELFPGAERQTRLTTGAGFVTRAGVRFDAAASFGGLRDTFAAGVGLRF